MLLLLSIMEKMTVIQDRETWIPVTALTGISMDQVSVSLCRTLLMTLDTVLALFHSVTVILKYSLHT